MTSAPPVSVPASPLRFSSPLTRLVRRTLPLAWAFTPLLLTGQTVAPASGKVEVSTVVLSPFTVTSSADVGYQAANTLAGSRMNTKLSETPASVSVFTEEFLKDLGATSLADVLEYGVNANADFNAVSTAPSFFYMDGALLNGVRVNNRGLFASQTVDFLETTLPIDAYNTGRFDVSSGPNSVLFGFGSAGGIVNAQTRAVDLRRTAVNLTAVAGSWSAYRAEADINVAAAKDRLGLRVMGVHDERDTWRRYARRETDRWTAVASFKPWKTTTLTALYEDGDLQNPSERPFNRIDNVSFWWDRGHGTVDNTSFGTSNTAVQNATGVRGAGIRNVWVSNDGRPVFARAGSANTVIYRSAGRYEAGVNSGIVAQRLESGAYQTLLPTTPQASGLPYSPYDINYYGPEAIRTNAINRKYFKLEQQLGRDGFLEFAYNREHGSGFSHQMSGDFAVYGDPNLYSPNPDGTATRVANPRAGQLYVEQIWYHNIEAVRNEVMRGTASWKLDLGRWGEHRLAGMAERSESTNRTTQGPEILVNATTRVPILNAAAPENGQNTLYRRNYVSANAPETFYAGSRFDTRPIVYGGATYVPRLITNANANGAVRQIDSMMLATQSRFFNGRLIATGGLRRDQVDITPFSNARIAATDPRVASGEKIANEYELLNEDPANRRSYDFKTYTAGAVVGVTKWLSGFYNESNNNGAPQTNRRMLPDAGLPVPPEGTGRDYGLMLNFLDGRLFARATAFNTESRNDPTVRDNAFIVAHRRIITAYRDNGLITQAEADTRSLNAYLGDFMSDLATNGYELEVKANPTKNWTLTASYSYTKLKRSNLGQDWYPWFAEQKAYYSRFPGSLVTTANNPVSTEIAQIETGVANLFALNELGYNNRPHKANAFVRYSFDGEKLKGFFIGSGVRWQDNNVLQREITGFDALGKDVLGKIQYGPEIFNVDALIGYSTRLKSGPLGRGTTLRAQLNIANAFDSERIQVIRLNRVGDGYWRVVPREPRSFRFSLSLGF
ncbi:TonB-dependent siderophore receptor [Horticoccus sp. 23ND18S-11]|uniref:TonB-dependent siderophore receptor n=1 Tax=Horticoccus sp. 23ND18S-11 TaxID=3391832 RepID=UPI0039C8CA19